MSAPPTTGAGALLAPPEGSAHGASGRDGPAAALQRPRSASSLRPLTAGAARTGSRAAPATDAIAMLLVATEEDCRQLITRSRRGGKTFREAQIEKQRLEVERKRQLSRGRGVSRSASAGAAPRSGKPGGGADSAAPKKVAASTSSGPPRRRGKKEEKVDELADLKDCVAKLISSQKDLDFCEKPFFRTALWEATWRNHEEIVKLLADHGASVSAKDYQGRTPLHEAAFYGHVSLVEFLLERGHPLDCEDFNGQTPLFRACEAGRHGVVEVLVKRGARTDALDDDSCTAAHAASFHGNPLMREWLVYNGSWRNMYGISEHRPGVPRKPNKSAWGNQSAPALTLPSPDAQDTTRSPFASSRGSSISRSASKHSAGQPARRPSPGRRNFSAEDKKRKEGLSMSGGRARSSSTVMDSAPVMTGLGADPLNQAKAEELQALRRQSVGALPQTPSRPHLGRGQTTPVLSHTPSQPQLGRAGSLGQTPSQGQLPGRPPPAPTLRPEALQQHALVDLSRPPLVASGFDSPVSAVTLRPTALGVRWQRPQRCCVTLVGTRADVALCFTWESVYSAPTCLE